MANIALNGILHHKGVVNEKTLRNGSVMNIQEIVIKQEFKTVSGSRDNFIVIEAIKPELIERIGHLFEGASVSFEVYPIGNEYTNKEGRTAWFSKLRLQKIDEVGGHYYPYTKAAMAARHQPAPAPAPAPAQSDDMPQWEADTDGFPFN